MKCATHPRYKAKRPPRVACRSCWALFFGVTSEKPSLEKRVAALEKAISKRPTSTLVRRAAETLHGDVSRYLDAVPGDCQHKYARLLRRTEAFLERLFADERV